jgi:hypothetical protein
VRVAQEAALANVMDAMESALAAGVKRPGGDAPRLAATPSAKRPRRMLDLAGDLSSDSDDEEEDEGEVSDAGEAAGVRSATPTPRGGPGRNILSCPVPSAVCACLGAAAVN